jgi:predicted nucleic acid-binding protein
LGLSDDLEGGPVGLDTAVFIYFIEEHFLYLPLVEQIFLALDEERLIGVTSTVTLLETLVVPFRAGDLSLAERYEVLLSHSRGLHLLDLNRPIVRLAARVRALKGLKTPDSLQVAAALQAGCSTFVTNDRKIPSVGGMRVLQLRDYL